MRTYNIIGEFEIKDTCCSTMVMCYINVPDHVGAEEASETLDKALLAAKQYMEYKGEGKEFLSALVPRALKLVDGHYGGNSSFVLVDGLSCIELDVLDEDEDE